MVLSVTYNKYICRIYFLATVFNVKNTLEYSQSKNGK